MGLTIVPLTFRQGSAFVAGHHRHHKPSRGCKFVIGVCDDDGVLRGVAMVGRPVARAYDDGLTIEVNRTATDGYPNANSALYGAAWRIAQGMGYRRLITYTEQGESGTSLRAANLVHVRDLPARKGWAESSVALRAIRDPIGSGGTQRSLWRIGQPLMNETALGSGLGEDIAPIDHMTHKEWHDRQGDLLDLLAEEGDPDGCSPYGCRSGAPVTV